MTNIQIIKEIKQIKERIKAIEEKNKLLDLLIFKFTKPKKNVNNKKPDRN